MARSQWLSTLLVLAVMMVVSAATAPAEPTEFHIVTYNALTSEGPMRYPEFSLQRACGIIEHNYYPADPQALVWATRKTELTPEQWKQTFAKEYSPLSPSFSTDLARAQLLYIGEKCHNYCRFLFRKPEHQAAIRSFLKGGGVLFFDYNASEPYISPFFTEIGVQVPDPAKSVRKYLKIAPSPEAVEHPLVTTPHRINYTLSAYGLWTEWGAKQLPVFVAETDEGIAAALLLQEDVLGKGTVIFSQIFDLFRSTSAKRTKSKKLFVNLLVYVYGPEFMESSIWPYLKGRY